MAGQGVVMICGGVGEVIHEDDGVDVVLLDVDVLNESGTNEQKEEFEYLVEKGMFDSAQELLADLEQEKQ